MKEKPVKLTTKPVSMMKQQRKIIQIATSNAMSSNDKIETIIALCNDGTLWHRVYGDDWFQIENVPQN